jgi:predicted metal-binding membrane protein
MPMAAARFSSTTGRRGDGGQRRVQADDARPVRGLPRRGGSVTRGDGGLEPIGSRARDGPRAPEPLEPARDPRAIPASAGCPSCSTIADGFDGFVVHLAHHDVTLSAVSRAPLAKLFPAVTIVWYASTSAMGEMPMPGGWTMSTAWMRMPRQTWPGAAASFLGMWVVMMVAMMLPSSVPMPWRYRQAVGRAGETRLGRLTALVGVGYFFVWTVFGMAVLVAGSLQLTAWKARHLACCREAPGRGRMLPADVGTAWRHGLRLGLHCSHCCAGLTAILLVIGVMDLRAMAVVAAAITVERLAPAGERTARAIGVVVVGAGLFLVARAAGLGRR